MSRLSQNLSFSRLLSARFASLSKVDLTFRPVLAFAQETKLASSIGMRELAFSQVRAVLFEKDMDDTVKSRRSKASSASRERSRKASSIWILFSSSSTLWKHRQTHGGRTCRVC